MRVGALRRSSNVEIRRGGVGGKAMIGGGAGLIIALIALFMGRDPGEILGQIEGPSTTAPTEITPEEAQAHEFISKILATTEDAWHHHLGDQYVEPRLVIYSQAVESACGMQGAAVGPFYCPRDQQAYLDLTFFAELHRRFGAPGDFAQAYVVAHEIGHHVQNLVGTGARGRSLGAEGDAVRTELQADCYAGVWGAYVQKQGVLEPGDVDEALRAATAIGDDTLQRRAQGRVTPETFSHGTSEQRARWFKRGMDSADPRACDTWATDRL
jgi:uncharacterized protein